MEMIDEGLDQDYNCSCLCSVAKLSPLDESLQGEEDDDELERAKA